MNRTWLVISIAGLGAATVLLSGWLSNAGPAVPGAAAQPATAGALPAPAARAASDPHAGILPGPAAPAAAAGTDAPDPALPAPGGRAHAAASIDPDAKFTHFRVGQRNVKRIMADGELMWVGTSGGVIRYNFATDEYRLFDLRSGLLANGVFHVGKLNERVAVGTYGGGLALYEASADRWDIYNIPQGLGDAFVYDALQTRNGDIWIATWSGVNRVRGGALDDPSAWELHTVKSTGGGLPNDWVYALAEGRAGEMWLATEGGLARFAGGEWRNWDHADGLGAPYALVESQIGFVNDPARYSQHHSRQKSEMGLQDVDVAYNPNYVVALLVDDEGTVWAGTWGAGLARLDADGWRNFTVADGLPGNHVFALHQDRQGRLWIGTSSGLARRQGEGFKVFTTNDGLYSDTVFSMDIAADGSTWVGSFGGVARIARLQ